MIALLGILLCSAALAQEAEPLRGDLNEDATLNKQDRKILRMIVREYRKHRRRNLIYEIPERADLNDNDKLGRKDKKILKRLVKRHNSQPDVQAPKLSASSAPEAAVPLTASPLKMRTNLARLAYYSPDWVFVDCFKQSMPWVSSNPSTYEWDDGREVEVRSDGGIILKEDQAATTLIYRNIDDHYPAGDYVCTFEGTGKIHFKFAAKKTLEQPNRVVAHVATPTNAGICLQVIESDPNDPVRNIQLWMPGFENSDRTFHPLFLERLAGYKHIRFVDWQRTINSEISDWSQRNTPNGSQDHEAGVAVEYMVQLCNTLNVNGWFHVPHQANDEWVRQFATYLRDHLEPGLKFYLEYSNETWNAIYTESKYVQDQGEALGLHSNRFTAGRYYHAQRSREIFEIFEEVFGGTDRFIRVLAGQAVNHFHSDLMLQYDKTYELVDAFAIAPYFWAKGIENRMPGATVDDVLELCEINIRTMVLDAVKLHKNISEKYGVDLISYEGGQHLVQSNDPELTELYRQANRDPRMYDLYALYFNVWAAQNGDNVFTNLNHLQKPTKWGSWGVLEYQDQPISEAPKFLAVLDAIAGQLPFYHTGDAQLTSLGVYD